MVETWLSWWLCHGDMFLVFALFTASGETFMQLVLFHSGRQGSSVYMAGRICGFRGRVSQPFGQD